MSDASLAVQTAIFSRLTAALAPTPVYDNVPQDLAPLFVRIGEDSANPSDVKNFNGSEHAVEINVYSSKRGFTETKQTIRKIYLELHRKPLYPIGYEATLPQFDFSECFAEPDGSRGVIRFRFQTQ